MALDFPASPVDGQVYDNYYYDAAMGSWRAYGTVNLAIPAGIINQYGGSVAPSGYLICDGQSVSTSTYPALFQAIGYTYGGSGSNFTIPNLQNRVPVGKGTETEFDVLGETGGAKTVALTEAQLPSHSHTTPTHAHTFSGTTTTDGSHSHTYTVQYHVGNTTNVGTNGQAISGSEQSGLYGAWNGIPPNQGTSANGSHSHTYSGTTGSSSPTTNTAGSSQAHNNLQPYIVLNYIIKT